MKSFKDFLTEAALPPELVKFLSNFKSTATGWDRATGEIADMADSVDLAIGKNTYPAQKPKTPQEHNKVHVNRIIKNFPKMSKQDQEFFLNKYSEWLK